MPNILDLIDPAHIIHTNKPKHKVEPDGPLDGIKTFLKQNEGILEMSVLAVVALKVLQSVARK